MKFNQPKVFLLWRLFSARPLVVNAKSQLYMDFACVYLYSYIWACGAGFKQKEGFWPAQISFCARHCQRVVIHAIDPQLDLKAAGLNFPRRVTQSPEFIGEWFGNNKDLWRVSSRYDWLENNEIYLSLLSRSPPQPRAPPTACVCEPPPRVDK